MHRIAIVGIGYWGPNIARSMAATQRAELAWLCDLDPDILQALGARYPQARRTTRYEEILEDASVRGMVLSTPTAAHFPLAVRAMEAGKDCLVEKPLTARSDQARHLVEVAQKTRCILMVGHVFEYNASIRLLKEIVDSGEVGEIQFLHMTRTNLGPVRTDVNALWDLASHDVAIANYLLGREPDTVSARGQSFLNPGIEDVTFANFSYPGEVMVHIYSSWLNPRKVRQITVVGSRKMVLWDDLDLQSPLRIFDKRVAFKHPKELEGTFLEHKTMVVDGGMTIPTVAGNQPLLAECHHFLDCLDHAAVPQSDGVSGLRVVLALEAAMASLASDSRICAVPRP
ncbi:MAG: Gfo/Idh/MocA family oxidoreductase [Magnetococcales bacterium]|nr:Gfo/Idh/MocA family oxidoreductase [Magnetococcales bacterium]